jgi:hypothetical protein
MDITPGKAKLRVARSRKSTERASNAPQGMNARKLEARILEMMPRGTWMTCTTVSRLIGASEDRKTRARLDRLVGDGYLERKRGQGAHGMVYMFRRISD